MTLIIENVDKNTEKALKAVAKISSCKVQTQEDFSYSPEFLKTLKDETRQLHQEIKNGEAKGYSSAKEMFRDMGINV
ncbi:DUF2683 family protein [Helicobacter sp. 11S02596-1]|uniref:DUF2683 family protein n=1 Tax=Helicobacter sp. 11S02596-1 TaxID=1476194 RepID=UPI000BA643A1|nr:DUF2683 family protein [Helicobacter sp. 11S02596-1]PAF43624.1 hypothetical protein BJI48_05050 [Helicobacter sp. 11S02596-1]